VGERLVIPAAVVASLRILEDIDFDETEMTDVERWCSMEVEDGMVVCAEIPKTFFFSLATQFN
jgi:hypothetical protein